MHRHVVIIGAVAAGPKAASRLRRLEPSTRITMVDEAEFISFGGCGIPYYVSGEVQDIDALKSTQYGTVRDPEFFAGIKDIHVINNTRAVRVDRATRTVYLRHKHNGKESSIVYDDLVLATGSTPRMPKLEGASLGNVTTVTSLEAAEHIRKLCSTGKVQRAVVVGAGFIGLEMAVALADMWGIQTTVVEFMSHPLPGAVSATMGAMVAHELESNGVTVLCSEKVQRLEGNTEGNVTKLYTDKRVLDTDLVLFATGFAPNTSLAKDMGLNLDAKTNAILVDEYMRTSDPHVYAGGDCVAVPHHITGKRAHFPLGSLANRQGRVIGTNLAGGQARFSGAVGAWAIKLFELSFCGVGLTEANATSEGFNALAVHAEQLNRAHFYPEKNMMGLEMVVDRTTKRVLGMQGVCADGDAIKARIDAVATMLQLGQPTVDDISNAEVAYAPPFSPALDLINVLGNVADNVLHGHIAVMNAKEFGSLWNDRQNNTVYFADCRPAAAAVTLAKEHPDHWHSLPLEAVATNPECVQNIPRDRPIALVCNVGLRAYEVLLLLRRHGVSDVRTVMGGMQAVQKCGIEL